VSKILPLYASSCGRHCSGPLLHERDNWQGACDFLSNLSQNKTKFKMSPQMTADIQWAHMKTQHEQSKIYWNSSPLKVSRRCFPAYQHTVSKLGNLNKSAVLNLFSISYALKIRHVHQKHEKKSDYSGYCQNVADYSRNNELCSSLNKRKVLQHVHVWVSTVWVTQ